MTIELKLKIEMNKTRLFGFKCQLYLRFYGEHLYLKVSNGAKINFPYQKVFIASLTFETKFKVKKCHTLWYLM